MTRKQQQTLIFSVLTAAVALLAVALFVYITQMQTPQVASSTFFSRLSQHTTRDGAPILGQASAPATVVVFLDFACPHCAMYESTVLDFIEAYVVPGKARLEMRVLAGVDPDGSRNAARAALCAVQQNAFWPMQEALLALQPAYGRRPFTTAHIRSVGDEINLDLVDLQNCLSNPTQIDESLQRNADLAVSMDVKSIPAVLLRGSGNRLQWIESDGAPLKGPLSLATLGAAVEGTLPTAN